MTIRVLLVEDHNVVREGLRLLLNAQPDMQVVAEATDGRAAVELAKQSFPDVAVVDIAMPEVDGIEATRLIRVACPQARILMLTMYESETYCLRAMEAGATGYVLKRAASEELIGAVRAVARGEIFLDPSVGHKLLDRLTHRGRGGPAGDELLSSRELEIMLLIVQGLSSQEITEKLELSASTVQTHRAHILQKLGLDTTVDLVRYAIRSGLIEP